jgi:uncharacterized membrane protein
MNSRAAPPRFVAANAIYGLLNPIPFGCFVAALVFDILYVRTAELLWDKGAAWLIVFGLLFAVVPRLLNLAQVWFARRNASRRADKVDFWLNLLAIVVAIFNAFVHSRDAYRGRAGRRLALRVHGASCCRSPASSSPSRLHRGARGHERVLPVASQ